MIMEQLLDAQKSVLFVVQDHAEMEEYVKKVGLCIIVNVQKVLVEKIATNVSFATAI